jgi:transposase
LDSEFVKAKKEYAIKKIEIWAQDEARLGLVPIMRKMWAPKGERPIALQTRKYQWIYVYSFVHPDTGKSFWLLLPTVNTALMNLALKEFFDFVNPGKEKHIILLIDGAGWHTSKELKAPEDIQIFPLPPYSPELQPVECGWPLLKEPVANRCIDTLDELEQSLVERCQWLIENPEILRGAVGFSWIREIESRID